MKSLTTTVLGWVFCMTFTLFSLTITAQDYDVRLSKTTIANGISDYNILVPFNITITNEGVLSVKNIDVVDYVPLGYDFLASDNDLTWSYDPGTRKATNTIVDTLDANDFAVLTILLRPQPRLDAADWINAAEIVDVDDINGVSISGQDADSNYDDTQGNETVGEDDYDEASVPIYDLALRKTLVTPQNSYTYGDDVVYRVQIFNQGNIAVQNVRITDYIPEGYDYIQADNIAEGWQMNGSTPFNRLPQIILPGDSTETFISLELSMMMADGQAWDNYTGIDSAYTTLGAPLFDDADSNPGSNSQSENSVAPNSADDDNIFGGGPLNNEDEDDHDVASLEIFDFALTKVKITAPESFSYGQTVNFATNIYNQGNQEADTVAIVDYIPCGYNFVASANSSGWSYDPSSRIARYKIAPAPLPNMDSVVTITLEVAPCYNDSTAWDNYAEIEYVIDTLGARRDDIDSTPDAIDDNDNGGVPNTLTDDQLDGDGTIDEDDHDPRSIEVVDFALKKTVFAPDTARYGEIVTFSIKGYNQGNITLFNVDVIDDIPVGYTYDPAMNLGWTVDPNEPQWTFPGPIYPGDSVEAFIDLVLLETQEVECEWVNYGELRQLRDFQGNRDDDADSFSFFETQAERDVKPGDPDDDNIFALGTNFGEDQDDHDPAQPEIFDLRLRKEIVSSPPYLFEDILQYRFTIKNEGNRNADTINVIDYLPEGLSFNAANQVENWTTDIDGNARLSITGGLTTGDSLQFSIFLSVECGSAGLENWTNLAEIYSAVDDRGMEAYDLDSEMDINPFNDLIGVEFEDNFDSVHLDVVDLALRKTVVSSGPFGFSSDVEFEVEVFNQGNVPLENVQIVDYIAPGYTFAAGNSDWVPLGGDYSYTFPNRLMPGDSVSKTIFLTLIPASPSTGREDYINYAEILSATDTFGIVVSGEDIDSSPGSDSNTSVDLDSAEDDNIFCTYLTNEEDDHDPAGVMVYDLALSKTIQTAGPYRYGDTLTYDIEITNEGTIPATNIELTDEIGCGLVFLNSNEPTWFYNSGSREATSTYTDTLYAGQSVVVSIQLEVEYCTGTYDATTYNNEVEITDAEDEDGNPGDDTDSTPDNDDPDEDDQDDEPIPVYDLALTKDIVTSPDGITNGDPVVFTFTIYNQGLDDLNDIEVVDYVPDGFNFVEGDNPGWTTNGPNAVYSIRDLASQSSFTFTISLEFDSTGTNWVNYTEIQSAENDANEEVAEDDADSTPNNNDTPATQEEPGSVGDGNITTQGENGIEDDNDPAAFELFDLALTKTIQTAGPYRYGDVLTYDIVITNEGTVPATNIEITDEIGCGLVFLDSNEPTWSYNTGSREATSTFTDTLNAGQSTVVSIQLELEYCTEIYDSFTYNNEVEITDAEDENGNPGDDSDSTPDNDDPDEDDQDDEPIPVYDLAITKNAVTSPIGITNGDPVEFTFTIYNQGLNDLNDLEIIDYVPDGFNFVEGDNPGWTESGSNAVYLLRDLASQASTTFTISLEFDSTGTNWVNYTEIQSAENDADEEVADDDADSTPNNNDTPATQEEPGSIGDGNITTQGENGIEDDNDPAAFGSFDLALTKEITNRPSNLKYGGQISYTITVKNEGTIPAQSIEVKDQLPCGLDFVQGPNPNWSYDNGSREAVTTLNGVLAPGASTTVDIELVLTYCTQMDAYTNVAQVSDNETPSDPDPTDDDSTPDNDDPNEDDQDDAPTEIVDLAVSNLLTDPGTLLMGSTVEFTIFITNQGNTTIDQITVANYFNAGYTMNDPNWAITPDGASRTINQSIAPGGTISTTINLTLVPSSITADYYNYAEIIGAQIGQIEVSNDDVDSEPGSDTPIERSVTPGSPDDNNILGQGPSVGEDEDDHDVAAADPFGTIGDYVWKDLDNDGIQDSNEPGVDGVTVTLSTCSGTFIANVVTANGGEYLFTNVVSGEYQLSFDISSQDGCIFTVPNAGSDDIDSDAFADGFTDCFTLDAGDDKDDVDAGLTGLSDIGDFVFEDLDGDGVQDNNEPGIPDVQVNLYDSTGNLLDSVTTDENGIYLFEDVSVGDYYLGFIVPQSDDYIPTLAFSPEGNSETDSNIDGSNGPNTTPTFTLLASSDDLSQDAGFYRCSTVCGLTWYDADMNNVRGSVENGINGLTVNAYRRESNGTFTLIATTLSADDPRSPSGDGYFEFCLRPGDYYIEVPLPPYGLVLAQPFQGGNSTTDSDIGSFNGPSTTRTFPITSNGEKCDIGAGFYPMATLGERVWYDENGDGLRNTNELPVADVVVEIFNSQNLKVDETITDVNGQYDVDYLQQEEYYVKFTPPSGYGFTAPMIDGGVSFDIDSDVDHSNGANTTRLLMMSAGEFMGDVDAGLAFGVLPVTWSSINVTSVDEGHYLTWTTESEVNTSHYEIERSIDNGSFDLIAKIQSFDLATGGTYDLLDEEVNRNGRYTYRVRQVDEDGRFSYSPQVFVLVDSKRDITLYPNPAIEQSTLLINTQSESTIIVELVDAQGRPLMLKDMGVLNEGSTSLDLDLNNYAPGIYTVRITMDNEIINKRLFIVR